MTPYEAARARLYVKGHLLLPQITCTTPEGAHLRANGDGPVDGVREPAGSSPQLSDELAARAAPTGSLVPPPVQGGFSPPGGGSPGPCRLLDR